MSAIYKSETGASEIQRRYRQTLRTWPVPAEHMRLPTRNAPPLVLLHGSGTNTTMWMGDITTWAQHYRTYAIDIIGEPGLSAPSRPPLASNAYAQWLDDVQQGLGITNASIVGTSLGGWLALDYATRQPQRVARLALLCPGGIGRQKTGWLFKTLPLRPFGRWGIRRSARTVTGLNTPEAQPVLDSLVLTFTQFNPRTQRLPVFTDDALRRLTMPVQVTVGGRDAMFDSQGTARRVHQCIPHATVNLLAEAGHAILGQTDPILTFLQH